MIPYFNFYLYPPQATYTFLHSFSREGLVVERDWPETEIVRDMINKSKLIVHGTVLKLSIKPNSPDQTTYNEIMSSLTY